MIEPKFKRAIWPTPSVEGWKNYSSMAEFLTTKETAWYRSKSAPSLSVLPHTAKEFPNVSSFCTLVLCTWYLVRSSIVSWIMIPGNLVPGAAWLYFSTLLAPRQDCLQDDSPDDERGCIRRPISQMLLLGFKGFTRTEKHGHLLAMAIVPAPAIVLPFGYF